MRSQRKQKVLEVATIVSTTLGSDFFRSLVEQLASVLGFRFVYLGESIGGVREKLRTIAVYRDGELAINFEQDLRGTASAQVLTDGIVSLSADAWRIFPLDPLLQDQQAEGYVGLRLNDTNGQMMGLIAAVSRERVPDLELAKIVMQTFAGRAAFELERKRAYDSARESEQRYKAFISSSMDGMWRIEFDVPIALNLPEAEQMYRIYQYGYVAECNDALARLLSAQTAEDLGGMPLVKLFPQTDERVYEELRSFVRSGCTAATVETTQVDADGKRFYRLRTHCGIVENNHLLRIWGITRDITDLRRAEFAVEIFDRRFRDVLESIRLPVLMLDTGGDITFCNEHMACLTGSSPTHWAGRNWLELVLGPERKQWEAVLAVRPPLRSGQHIDGVVRSADGLTHNVGWDTIAIRGEAGEMIGLVAIATRIH